jgi:hypothetical protein
VPIHSLRATIQEISYLTMSLVWGQDGGRSERTELSRNHVMVTSTRVCMSPVLELGFAPGAGAAGACATQPLTVLRSIPRLLLLAYAPPPPVRSLISSLYSHKAKARTSNMALAKLPATLLLALMASPLMVRAARNSNATTWNTSSGMSQYQLSVC